MDDLKDAPVEDGASGGAGAQGGQGGGGGGSPGRSGVGGGPPPAAHYSIPGILHFLQHEWSRFEMERSQWEVEKAELQARIAFLQGERKGQENLKNDLVRRIKMLEYALKQERAKYNKLKYGPDSAGALAGADEKPPTDEDGVELPPLDGDNYVSVTNINWRQGRQLLRQYLQEIGYTDTIIDVRSNRVRSLLGLGDVNDANEENNRNNLTMNGGEGAPAATGAGGGGAANTNAGNTATARRVTPGQQQQQQQQQGDGSGGGGGGQQQQGGGSARRGVATTLAEEMLIDTEAAVMANFDFLTSETEIDDDEDDDGEDGFGASGELKTKAAGKLAQAVAAAAAAAGNSDDSEEVMNEFNFLSNPDQVDSIKGGADDMGKDLSTSESYDGLAADWGIEQAELERLKSLYKGSQNKRRGASDFFGGGRSGTKANAGATASAAQSAAAPAASAADSGGGDKGKVAQELGANLELGELEQLTITNDNESSYDITAPKEAFRKTWSAKYTLRSHFDGVRALAFHPAEPVLITASEDQTLKLWNLQKTIPAKKSASLDVEPVYTFRAHRGPVLSLAVASAGDALFSGGADGTVRCWAMPPSSVDPYNSFDPSVLTATLQGHKDAVWGLAHHAARSQLLSCSADGTVKLWSVGKGQQSSQSALVSTFGTTDSGTSVPTSADWVREDSAHMVAAYSNAACVIYDVESGKPVIKLDTNSSSTPQEMGPITKVISHPTLPLTITAHEDRHIRFFDNSTGKLTHAMVAHLDAVTSLSIDSNGLYLISGSHDCSVRLWNLETKTCVQEITAHRKKFDESIFDVAFHPTKPFIASAGADALAKVFV